MNLKGLITVALLLAAALGAAGQEGYRMSNNAFLDTFKGHTASASLDFRKDDGGLISLSQSPDSYLTGASTQSWYRVSDRLGFYGKMSWQYFQGKDMGGQILMDPDYNPVNFLENTLATKGVKKKETYCLGGGLSWRLGQRWALGAGISYTSADQTKIKDPRFSNVWMDVDVHVGTMFRAGEKLLLGASLTYRNTIEQLRGGIYGTTDKQYYVSTDKGGFMGTVAELTGDYNYVPVSETRPMINNFYGVSLQTAMDGVFTSELWIRKRDGYYGRRSSTKAIYFVFGGLEGGYSGRVSMPGGHSLYLDVKAETLSNAENKFRYVTPSGKNTVVDYTGQDQVSRRFNLSGLLGYSWHGRNLSAGLSLDGRTGREKTTLYPLYRIRNVSSAGADIWGRYSFSVLGTYSNVSVEAHAMAGGGFGNPAQDGTLASASSTAIRSFDDYLYRQFEYDTAKRAGACLSVKYTMPAGRGFTPYVGVSDSYTTLLSAPEFLDGASRNTATITLGCNF